MKISENLLTSNNLGVYRTKSPLEIHHTLFYAINEQNLKQVVMFCHLKTRCYVNTVLM